MSRGLSTFVGEGEGEQWRWASDVALTSSSPKPNETARQHRLIAANRRDRSAETQGVRCIDSLAYESCDAEQDLKIYRGHAVLDRLTNVAAQIFRSLPLHIKKVTRKTVAQTIKQRWPR